MVNDNQNYCQNFNLWKWTVFYFWVNFGRMKYCNLPSFHPYWKNERKKVAKKQLNQMIIKYNECKKNPEKIKYYFNSSATLDSIKENVKKHKEELKK